MPTQSTKKTKRKKTLRSKRKTKKLDHSNLYNTFSLLFLALTIVYAYFAYFSFETLLMTRSFGIEMFIPVLLSAFSIFSFFITLSLFAQRKDAKNTWGYCVKSTAVFPITSLILSYFLLSKYELVIKYAISYGAHFTDLFSGMVIALTIIAVSTFVLLKVTKEVF